MTLFREGIENLDSVNGKTVVEQDLIELGQKIDAYHNGLISEDKFKALRLARGVYGQRQQGVQMIRIKLPFGKVTTNQLRRIARVSDEYSTGKLHITTRQDIQIHHVSLDRTPELWAELEKDDVTLREACGNTVRNVTASHIAGIDPEEPFDVSPYAHLVFRYFLRKPFGQELGRKIKISFSSNNRDEAYSFIHDFGFIPRIQNGEKGFKVLVGGGLGAQPILAQTAFEFLSECEIIPFIEASIRVFDRYGERNNRNKARMKYLIAKIGFETFMSLVNEERKAVQYTGNDFQLVEQQEVIDIPNSEVSVDELITNSTDSFFVKWLKTNVFKQKQSPFYGVYVKVQLGDFNSDQARELAKLVDTYAANDIRFTINQNILLKFVAAENLEALYEGLRRINLHAFGYNSVADITACPGTDTCNLGISNSTRVAQVIEELIQDEYADLVFNQEIKIKISGCMNSCGQHGLAHIGFHGSSMKVNQSTVPALQVLLGGGNLGGGNGRVADKVIKVPSKRVLEVIRYLLNDYLNNQTEDEYFNDYYERKGNKYFYDLLKPLTETETLVDADFIDWGSEAKFKTEIGVGECAGVVIDLVATLFYDAYEKLESARNALDQKRYADAVYFAYSGGVHAAKALLIGENVRCNSHQTILEDFDKLLSSQYGFDTENSFEKLILQIKTNRPDEQFATHYIDEVFRFVHKIKR